MRRKCLHVREWHVGKVEVGSEGAVGYAWSGRLRL